MPSFRLPRLRSNLSIVNRDGKPLDYFLRLFNIELAQRIEAVVNAQQELIDQIIAAQAAAAAAQAAADTAQATADTAQTTADSAYSGAATDKAVIAADVSSTTYVTLASITFPNRQKADGFWNADITLSGYGDGVSSGDVDLRLIELGEAVALSETSVSVPNGPPTAQLSVFFPTGPWPQTAPIGDITVVLEAKRAVAGDFTRLDGEVAISYTPRPE